MKIAVCDDSEIDREHIEAALFTIQEKWKMDFEISFFESGEKLCESISENSYDIFLLDIVMRKIDGIETAKYIRNVNYDASIVFISNYDERLRELLKVGAIDFLDKPLQTKDLEGVLQRIYNNINEHQEKFFVYKIGKLEKFVSLKDIMFIESKAYQSEINAKNEKIIVNQGINKIWNTIKVNDSFIRPHKSFIVNLKNAKLLSKTSILLPDNIEIAVGRKFKEDTISRYMAYIRRRS